MSWTRGPTIGRGATAAVSLAATPAGHLFAVKSADLASSFLLRNEECFISRLSSPYVIRCLGSDVTRHGDKPVYNLFLEYSAGGALSDLIRKQGGLLDEELIRLYAHQLVLGVEYLHRNGLVHCDIKADNILIGSDVLKIADFGCAKWACFGAEAFSGTPAYMAPEVARGEEQSFPADVWALGCTVIEMATGTHPWPEMKDPAAALYRIAFSSDVPDFPSWLSVDAKDFLGKCLARDPKKRWTAAELLRHPFLACCEGIRELTRRSPTSVTDQWFWDAVEASEPCEDTPMETASDSPSRRVEALICGGDRRWSEEQEWVTVRSNQTEGFDEDVNQDFGEGIHVTVEQLGIPASNFEECWFDFCDTSNSSNYTKYFISMYSKLRLKLVELFVHQDLIVICWKEYWYEFDDDVCDGKMTGMILIGSASKQNNCFKILLMLSIPM